MKEDKIYEYTLNNLYRPYGEEYQQACDMYQQEMRNGKCVVEKYTPPPKITQEMLDDYVDKVVKCLNLPRDEIIMHSKWMLGANIPLHVPESIIEMCKVSEPKEFINYINALCEKFTK